MLKITLKTLILLAGFLLFSGGLFSQTDSIPVRDDRSQIIPTELTHHFDFGLGLGLDYGGLLGIQVGVAPVKHLTFFAALGYYMIELGWNVGVKGLLISKTTDHTFRPFLKVMYGCNSVIIVDGADQYDQVYHGFTTGLGMEFRFGKMKKNGFDLDLNIPLRTIDFWDDWQTIKNDPNLEVLQDPIPVAFSIGFHHEF
jgi:hypothetical protein